MATAALAPPPQETPPSSEGSPQAAALAAAARGTPTEHHRRGRTSCDRGTSSHVYAPPPQAAAPSVATCGTSSEHQQSIIRTSADHHQQDISRTSAEHQQNVSRTSAEHHQNISSGTGAAAPGAAALAHAAHQNNGVRRPSKSGGRKGLGGTACLRVPCIEPHTAWGREGGAGHAVLCGTACQRAPRHRKPPRHPLATLHGAPRHSLPEGASGLQPS